MATGDQSTDAPSFEEARGALRPERFDVAREVAAARARGRIGGRERIVTPDMERRAIRMLKRGEPVSVVARELGVSKSLITQRRRGEWAPRIAEVDHDDEAD